MSGIYIHILFANKRVIATSIFDFHEKKKRKWVLALAKFAWRKSEAVFSTARTDIVIETIYFGGGTLAYWLQNWFFDCNSLWALFGNRKSEITLEILMICQPNGLLNFRKAKSMIKYRYSIFLKIYKWWTDALIRRKPKMFKKRQTILTIFRSIWYTEFGMSNEKWKMNIEQALSFKFRIFQLCFYKSPKQL
jgi:hypothetical protein